MSNTLTRYRLHELLCYKRHTGLFTLKADTKYHKKGDIAGAGKEGQYIRIWVDGEKHGAHRLAILYVEGYLPEHDTDHRDGDRQNNRFRNLRHVSRSCNLQNSKVQKRSTTGFTGVSQRSGSKKFTSRIMDIHIGMFDTAVDAAIARVKYEDSCEEWTCNAQDCNRKKLRALGYDV